ncbi:MAG: peptide chain release factor N(5)-glutamine methyltransferase [Opitutales bacterium]|nr:peptide chain release factor N(5)-glutamine methyltransferase [Opitutales bacterium]
MHTVLELLQKTAAFFTEKGVPRPRLDAEWLLADVLGLKRMDLYLQFERPLTEQEVARYRENVRRRSRREPLQYILGETDFRDLTLTCDARALVPRPETEELMEIFLQKWAAASPENGAAGPFLDLGTGTGALALSLARHFPEAPVWGVDISAEALLLAKENSVRNGLPEEKLFWRESNWFEAIPAEQRFAAILANPPYLTEEEWASAEPEVREFEPQNALVAPEAGLADLRTIIEEAPAYLLPRGWLAVETGIAHREAIAKLTQNDSWAHAEPVNDHTQRPRYWFLQKA